MQREKRGSVDEVWRLGILIEASSTLPPLKDHLLTVIHYNVPPASIPIQSDAIALCKVSLLDTFEHANDYTGNEGYPLNAADESRCRYPSVLIAHTLNGPGDLVNIEGDLVDIQCPEDLQAYVGTGHPLKPTIFLVSHDFLATYGFFSKENVWFREITPLPLDQVILVPTGDTMDSLSDSQIEEVVRELYEKCQNEPVVMQQNFIFIFKSKYHGVLLTFHVLETQPVCQGRITERTTIALLPPEDRSPSPDRKLTGKESEEEFPPRGRSASDASASDLNHEYSTSYLNLLTQGSVQEDYIIEAVAPSNFKLLSQYVVIPKESAVKHGIFALQPIMVSLAESDSDEPGVSISNLTLSLGPIPGAEAVDEHLALAIWYEDEATLQKYVPPPSLGYHYTRESLQLAYIHPHLLFNMFPETLSPTRKFTLHITCISMEQVPPVKSFAVSQVSLPSQPYLTQDNHVVALKSFFQSKTLYVTLADVFTIVIEAGKVYYKFRALEPNVGQATKNGIIDGLTYRECSIMVNKKQSYVPDFVPPFPCFNPPSYWTHIHPAGLEDHCNTLFSYFIPLLSTKRPPRSPSVLLSGPPGVGKRTVVRAVARRYRMNILELNCYEYSSDAVAFAEKKLIQDIKNAFDAPPVILLLRQVHMLGRKDNNTEEPRLAAAFEGFMEDLSRINQNNAFPVLVVGVTSQVHRVSPQIHACFLQQLVMTPPTQTQRERMMKGLAREYLISPEVDWGELAKKTAGFVLGDFVALFSQASHLAFMDATTYCSDVQGWYRNEDLAIAGVLITLNHLEAALELLHSSHSDAIGAPKIPDVKWEDVGGLVDAKREILDTIQLPLLHPEMFTAGLRRSGVLLYGAPGTGKTLLAKAVATECSLNFLSVKGPEIINMYIGQSEENIREVFARARSAAPCVVFFDELDSITPNRGRSGDSGGVMDRVVSQLLAELDGLQRSEDVFVIGATNRPDLIDPALLRPGRFDRLVYLDISEDIESKVKVLKAITRKFNLGPKVDLDSLASQCPVNLTGADLYALCSDAMLTALRRHVEELELQGSSDDRWEGDLIVTREDFLVALRNLTPSVSMEELKRYKDLGRSMPS